MCGFVGSMRLFYFVLNGFLNFFNNNNIYLQIISTVIIILLDYKQVFTALTCMSTKYIYVYIFSVLHLYCYVELVNDEKLFVTCWPGSYRDPTVHFRVYSSGVQRRQSIQILLLKFIIYHTLGLSITSVKSPESSKQIPQIYFQYKMRRLQNQWIAAPSVKYPSHKHCYSQRSQNRVAAISNKPSSYSLTISWQPTTCDH